jgi:hypothetical protein
MANETTTEPPAMTPSQIGGLVQQRVGGGGIGQDFESWRYNEPQGDFGTAYPKSRRKMRMEEEYRQYQAGELERQKILQQMDIQAKQYDLQFQAEQRMQEKQRLDLDREGKVQDQARMVMESIRGTTLPDGQRTRPINIEDDDAVERLQSVIYSNPFGMENQATKEAATMMLNDALGMRERKLQASQEQELAAATLSARTGKPMEELGEYTPEGIFKPNLNAIVKTQEEIKEKEEQRIKERDKKEPVNTALNQEAKELRGKIRDIDLEIISENNLLEKAKTDKDRQLAQSQIDKLNTQRDRVVSDYNEIQKTMGGQAGKREQEGVKTEIPKFDSAEAAESANLPAGTIIEINGRRARID